MKEKDFMETLFLGMGIKFPSLFSKKPYKEVKTGLNRYYFDANGNNIPKDKIIQGEIYAIIEATNKKDAIKKYNKLNRAK